MLKMKKISSLALIMAALFTTTACNEEKKAENAAPTTATQPAQDEAKKEVKSADTSYAVGVLFGSEMKMTLDSQKDLMSYNQEKILQGIQEAINGKANVNQPEIEASLKQLQEQLQQAAQTKAAEQAKKAQEESDKLIAEFNKKEGVKTTASGLLYRIEKVGEGNPIKATDTVKVHYTGKLANGTVFDSSVERGQPAEFVLNQVIPGWTEGLQLIKKGGKIELVIPANLAYGEQDLGVIPANSTLYFDVEVLDVTPKK